MDAGKLIGRGISFPPRVGPDGRVQWSEGERNVRENIQVILATEPPERLLLPEFGAGLARYLFEPNTVATRAQIADSISRALARWEPRIIVESVDVEADPQDDRAATATLTYKLVATGARERLSLSVTLAG
ncbi:GPW/gp25 family protein [Pyxidicoccus xibeiensis]|uniref:GPW/gp25 family protein n=1 Tax=Pyxidicoccus xibeiensis TaxID=2906759 RepID=UPI0020A80E97|nr:GPW/gp25 family protein [Pyxidicoccus xibeiensis]MCP3137359.1 GPW/gp25 family protein [Pyxidicoccus xibeiensis]